MEEEGAEVGEVEEVEKGAMEADMWTVIELSQEESTSALDERYTARVWPAINESPQWAPIFSPATASS